MPGWPPIVDGSTRFDLRHLDPFTLAFELDGRRVCLHVDFGPHVFSSEAGDGVRIPWLREARRFCRKRWHSSVDAAHFMRETFVDGHVRSFLNHRQKQQFYALEAGDLAVFLTLQKAADEDDAIKCRVVSAYRATWGRHALPRGKLYAVRTVLRRRLDGAPIRV